MLIISKLYKNRDYDFEPLSLFINLNTILIDFKLSEPTAPKFLVINCNLRLEIFYFQTLLDEIFGDMNLYPQAFYETM